MSRNKYPEETRKLIIDVSTRLFITHGYEKTSLQDIIDNLGGLTKGAIYHHFRSREAILVAVIEEICHENTCLMASIRDDNTLNGKDKLQKMFTSSLSDTKQGAKIRLFETTPNMLDSPSFLAYYIRMFFEDTISHYIVPVFREGAAAFWSGTV